MRPSASRVASRAVSKRAASKTFNLAAEVREYVEYAQGYVNEGRLALQFNVEGTLRANEFEPSNVRVSQERGWLEVSGKVRDKRADSWRGRDDVDQLFHDAFGVYPQLSGHAPDWTFTMGGFAGLSV